MKKVRMALPKPPKNFDENPPWSAKDFAKARPASEVVPDIVAAAKRRGRPKLDRPKVQLTLRLDANVVDAYKSKGAGWQSAINDALRRAAKIR
ncbi:MAG TPA: BrnA antitoxin family protein [Rhizomicrobium sp.]|nr:BrnA antitoxin family protein [Rhizomicrobium sp.]